MYVLSWCKQVKLVPFQVNAPYDIGSSIESYISNMRKPGIWGDQVVLVAASMMLGNSMTVINSTGYSRTFGPENTVPICLGNEHLHHFMLLEKIPGKTRQFILIMPKFKSSSIK